MAHSCPGSTSNPILGLNASPLQAPDPHIYIMSLSLRLSRGHAHLSQCRGTAGCDSRCPSLLPQYSSTPATSRFGPRYCHTHLELLCQSNTHDARCSRVPAWEGWVFEVGEGLEAWLEDQGWQVLGAASLGTCLKKQKARYSLRLPFSQVSDGGRGLEGTSRQWLNRTTRFWS